MWHGELCVAFLICSNNTRGLIRKYHGSVQAPRLQIALWLKRAATSPIRVANVAQKRMASGSSAVAKAPHQNNDSATGRGCGVDQPDRILIDLGPRHCYNGYSDEVAHCYHIQLPHYRGSQSLRLPGPASLLTSQLASLLEASTSSTDFGTSGPTWLHLGSHLTGCHLFAPGSDSFSALIRIQDRNELHSYAQLRLGD